MTTGFIGADSATVDGIAIDLSVPSTVQSGDVLVLIATAAVSGTFTTPSGWTQDGGNAAVMLAYKTATASDPGAVVQVVYSGNGLFCAGLVAYRPASGGLVSINYGTGLLASGVSTTAANQTAVAFWVACGNNGNGIAPPTSMDGGIRYDAQTPTNACVVADLLQTTAGACPAEQATGGSATGYENVWAYFVVQVAAAPQAATLAYPPNASYLDASTVDLQAIFNSSDGANANADCVRIKAAGASSYSYVNTSTNALQSTPVWNPCTVSPGYPIAVSLPSGAVSDGNIYNWSIAFQEALANLQGPFASDFTFTAQAPPGLTVSEPAGSETTGAIALTYTATPQSGTSIIGGRWLIYPTATSSAPGFTINIGVGTIPAGAVSDVTWTGNPLTVPAQSGVALTAGGFTAFAAVQETGSVWSSTIPSAFTVAFDPPAQPSVTAVASTEPSTGAPTVAGTVQGHDNIPSAADASFEGSLGTWTAGANTSIALSSAEALDGTDSLAISATAAGNTLTYGTTYSIVGGASYVWVGAARAAASSRTFEEYVNFKDNSGTYISNIAATASDDTAGWTYAIGVGAAPSNAATAYLSNVVEAAAASELHYLDNCGIFPGDTLGYQLEVLSDGPSVYFPLTDGPGSLTAANAVGSGVGTVTGGVTFGQPGVVASDPSQTAALFDGTTGHVSTTFNPSGLTALTVEAWINCNNITPTSQKRIAANDHTDVSHLGFQLTTAPFNLYVGNGTTYAQAGNGSVPLTGRHHLVGTWDGATIRAYLDGAQLPSTAALTGTLAAGGYGTAIGYDPAYSGDYFNGAITHVALYPTALTAARIQAHYQAALNTSGSIVQKWTRGGLAGTTTSTVTRTGQNAGTVATVPLPAPSQAAAITDNAVEFGADITYTAVVQATV